VQALRSLAQEVERLKASTFVLEDRDEEAARGALQALGARVQLWVTDLTKKANEGRGRGLRWIKRKFDVTRSDDTP
jgi:hypothetical protein